MTASHSLSLCPNTVNIFHKAMYKFIFFRFPANACVSSSQPKYFERISISAWPCFSHMSDCIIDTNRHNVTHILWYSFTSQTIVFVTDLNFPNYGTKQSYFENKHLFSPFIIFRLFWLITLTFRWSTFTSFITIRSYFGKVLPILISRTYSKIIFSHFELYK